jgi:hypothetical protein
LQVVTLPGAAQAADADLITLGLDAAEDDVRHHLSLSFALA